MGSAASLALGISNAYSLAYGTAGDITVGEGGNNGGAPDTGKALRWNANGSALNLQQFASGATRSSARSINANTGIIVGSADGKAASWTPLITGGTNNLAVTPGTTTTINQNFTQSAGSTVVNGALNMTGNTFTLAGGTLGGSGTITGNVAATGGTIAPGNSPGTLSITGNFAMTVGTYQIELASPSSFDVIAATGTASLSGGTFSVTTLGSYAPNVGDSFNIVTTGGGITIGSMTVPAGYTFTQSGNNGRLTFAGRRLFPKRERDCWHCLRYRLARLPGARDLRPCAEENKTTESGKARGSGRLSSRTPRLFCVSLRLEPTTCGVG